VRAKGVGAGTCHSFIVINPEIFGDAKQQEEHLSVFLQELRDAKRVDPDVPIYTHGEKECISMEEVRRKGIDVNVSTVAEMVNICNYLGMDSVAYLGQVDVSNAKIGTYEKVYK
jgi:LDH2 family malate/lactate/ureidoglycolate dehydrogenase